MNAIKFFIIILLLTFVGGLMAQTDVKTTGDTKNQYFKSQEEVKGKTAYTEIVINASPEKVREEFLKLDEWPNWNQVIVKIDVIKGDMNDLSTKPQLDGLFHIDTTKAPQPAPFGLKVWLTENSKEAFVWEVKNGMIKAKHVFLFLPSDGGKATKMLHYERMTGFLSLFFSKKMRRVMKNRYDNMNDEFKRLCEK